MLRVSQEKNGIDQGTNQMKLKQFCALFSWEVWAVASAFIALNFPVMADAGEYSATEIEMGAQPPSIQSDSGSINSFLNVGDSNMSNRKDVSVTAQKNPAPPPFSPQDFWTKVVRVISENKGYVTHDKFESGFGVIMTKGAQIEEVTGFSLRAGEDWYFETGIRETTAHYKDLSDYAFSGVTSGLHMQWPVDAFGDWRQGKCVLAGYAIKALLNVGWKLEEKKVWMMNNAELMGDQFSLGKSRLFLKHYVHYLDPVHPDDSATCVTEFSVVGKA